MSARTCQNKSITREQLLETGMQVMLEKGYSNAGIQEILNRCDVPKGSFYYYFESKEEFALEIINHFDREFTARVLRCLCNKQSSELSPLQRLHAFCQCNKESLAQSQCRKGCLVGNLSQEMADQSETLRRRLEQIMEQWRNLFAACIEEGQRIGEIKNDYNAADMAELFLSGWEGAMMRAKSTKTLEPIDAFVRVMFEHVLKAKQPAAA
jgi:TetR/AcrR family transcriptional repressor of nem operon